MKQLIIGYRHLSPVGITDCAFADDVVLRAGPDRDLQNNIYVYDEQVEHKNKLTED